MKKLHPGRLPALFTAAVLAAATACDSGSDGPASVFVATDGRPDGDAGPSSSIDGGALTSPSTCTPFMPYGSGSERYGIGFGLGALRAVLGLDYLAIRTENRYSFDDAGLSAPRESGVGESCSGATDKDACATKLAAVSSTVGNLWEHDDFGSGWLQYLVYTRGDEVGGVFDRAGLLALLGPIDAVSKASLVAEQRGYLAQCDKPWVREDSDGFVLLTLVLISSCPYQYADVLVRVAADGTVTELQRSERAATTACAGRRPEGLVLGGTAGASAGAYFAHVAQLEAASIDAFHILRDELAAHGAPQSLLDDAERAARDEIRHARAMNRLAERLGAAASARPSVPRVPVRTLEAIAIENAREGCIREAYGALEATWQARYAPDSRVRHTLSAIARDEVTHAELAWRVAFWLDERLDVTARARVTAARTEALEELATELATRSVVDAAAGLPSPTEALALLRQLEPITQSLAA